MSAWLPVLTLMTSLIPALVIFRIPEQRRALRTAVNLGGALAKLGLVALMLGGVAAGEIYEARLALAPGLELLLRVDALCLLFLTLSAFLWLLTTIYAIAYFGHTPNQSRFFGFFSLCVAATTGVALSGTLITFFIFYEFLTLATWPLVTHKGEEASISAGRKYLAYTLGGSALLLIGMVWLESMAGPVEFAIHDRLVGLDRTSLQIIFFLLVGGLGVKAALIPLHGWLPAAMVAPAPVSALLHAVAVVKAGAFGIVRIVYDVYGFTLVQALGVGIPLAAIASATILWGSLRALFQRDIKKRLAYSTVSQVSYIVLGTALAGPAATVGGLVHIVHQGLMKITLFFCAGALAERAGVTKVDQLDGVGRAMPLTMFAFSIAALGMIGVPPVAGFVSKWQLGVGGLQAGQLWVIFILATSSLLNAAYFLPLVYRAWFRPAEAAYPPGRERSAMLIGPALVTAAVALLVGLFAGMDYSPLRWAQLIVSREYGL
jgi:multicomponent Na+:H+ antiporter subunit D